MGAADGDLLAGRISTKVVKARWPSAP